MEFKIELIAEVGQAHEGSIGIAHSYIDALSSIGVDAIKFQTHIAEAESSSLEEFRINFSYEDNSRFDYWKRMEFSVEQWAGLKNHCDQLGVEFISSPFSCAAVDLLESIGVKRYKIGSGEISNFLMLHKIASTSKPIILSTGMSDFLEIDKTLDFLKPYNCNLSLLQCTTSYPALPNDWGLLEIVKLKNRYNIKIGFSDHSSDITACISAASLGAEILEFHAVFHKSMFGPDSKASLDLSEIKQVVSSVRNIEKSLNNNNGKIITPNFLLLKTIFGKSLAVNKDLFIGHILTIDDLESKKPGNVGISADRFLSIIGKTINRNMKQWEFIKESDFT
jgi:N,N'-diacetyllegionaminate synthase